MKKIILNHRCNLNIEEIYEYKKEYEKLKKDNVEVILFPNILYLSLFNNVDYNVGASNFYPESCGNFTGEISLSNLDALGINYTMVNHKDRNAIDAKEIKREKLERSLKNEFKTVLVIGEDKLDKDPFKDIRKKLDYLFKNIKNIENLIVLYEPNWLLNDDSQDVNTVRKVIIDIKEYFISKYKSDVDVLYGGAFDIDGINEVLNVCDGVGFSTISTNISQIKEIFDKID